MHVNPAETSTIQAIRTHEVHDLRVLGKWRARERFQQGDDLRAICNGTAGQFADDEGVTKHVTISKKRTEFVITPAKMINPNRSINQRHEFLFAFGEPFSVSFPCRLKLRAGARSLGR